MEQQTKEKKRVGRPPGSKDKVKRKTGRPATSGTFKPGALDPITEPGDNARFLRFALDAWYLPPIDISDPVQVEERVIFYFRKCIAEDIKPGVAGLCNYLGIDRNTFYQWSAGLRRGNDGGHESVAKKARILLENMMEEYMQTGKINPVTGIFLMKNHFGYQDKQEVVVSPKDPALDGSTAEEIKARYIESVVTDPDQLPPPQGPGTIDLVPLPDGQKAE